MSDHKPLPIGIQTFRDIVTGGYLYVDKTAWIYELIRHPKGVYFLSRPRRFGKSLLISTLDAIFQGERDLFTGLWLYDSSYQWQEHPVIRLDFSRSPVRSAAELEKNIERMLGRIAQQHNITLSSGNYAQLFEDLILDLAQQGQVVILVDEYDKPILDNIEGLEEAKRIRETLKSFYTVIKSMDAYVRFVLLTGVSKFSKVGVFSGLNNLRDISFDNRYAAMLGITQSELEGYFQVTLPTLAAQQGQTAAELLADIRAWYNGFCFSNACEPVYNPFSLFLFWDAQRFGNYWFESGTPTFLLKLIQSRGYDVPQLEQLNLPELAFSSYEIESLDIVPLLYQTGYLTIKGYDPETRRYRLYYPNYEVEHAFSYHLLGVFGDVELALATDYLGRLAQALRERTWEEFFAILNTLLANIPYEMHIRQERYYQTVFYLVLKLLGLEITGEPSTSRGRPDAVVTLPDGVFIFEFKLDGTAVSALQQIKARQYFAAYKETGKPITLVGANFATDTRQISEWQIEVLSL